jgi:hypothetical protein
VSFISFEKVTVFNLGIYFCIVLLVDAESTTRWLVTPAETGSKRYDVQGARFNFVHNYVTDHSQLSISLGNDS